MSINSSVTRLAIAVPSYKRPYLLRACLDALRIDCSTFSVPVYVYDDSCSSINDSVYLDSLEAGLPLVVVRNAVNLGIDANIDQCVSATPASYVWLMGEDDLVEPGAVGVVLSRLTEADPPYLFVNYRYVSNDYVREFGTAVEFSHQVWTAGTFFSRHGWATGFLGANVVSKTRWRSEDCSFIGSYFSHVGKIFSQLSPTEPIGVIARPLVRNRAESLDSFTWLSDAFEVWDGFRVMVNGLKVAHPNWAPFAESGLAGFESRLGLARLKTLFALRALGVYDWSKYKRYLREERLSPLYAVVSVLPVSLLRQGRLAVRAARAFFTLT